VPQIRPLADIPYFKYAPTYLLTYLLTKVYGDIFTSVYEGKGS